MYTIAYVCDSKYNRKAMLREGITFDDVLLVPRRSRVFSRKDVDTRSLLSKNILLNIPLISANMDTVTEACMARAMAESGGIGFLHSFFSFLKTSTGIR